MLRGIRRPTWHSVALKDKLRVFTTVGFPALQFNAVNKQFVATRKVPQGVGEQSQERLFAALVPDAKAVTQVTGSFSLTWPALGQRKPTATTDCLLEVQLFELVKYSH